MKIEKKTGLFLTNRNPRQIFRSLTHDINDGGQGQTMTPVLPLLDRILTSLMDASSQLSLERFVEDGGQERGEFGSGLSLQFL